AGWVEIEACDRGSVIASAKVAGSTRIAVPLDIEIATAVKTIELRVVASSRDARRRLPIFEARDALCYRVRRACVRRASPSDGRNPFPYPAASWTSVSHRSAVQLTATSNGVAVQTDRHRFSYAVQYGPLCAPGRDLYRFQLEYRIA